MSSDVRALGFLYVRTFVNGLKRAIRSPRRMISLLVFGAYYVGVFVRPMAVASHGGGAPGPSLKLPMPPLQIIDAVVFAMFAVLTLPGFGRLSAWSFRQSDVDVLFPTPIEPRVVLVFRFLRDYLISLLVPLLLVVVGWRASAVGFETLFRDFPRYGNLTLRAMWAAWLLLSLSLVSLAYGLGILCERPDEVGARARRIRNDVRWAALLAGLLAIGVGLRNGVSVESAVALAHSPILRVVFFAGSAATALTMAPLEGRLLPALLGVGGLVLLAVAGLRLALSQVEWLYDEAATRGFGAEEMTALRAKGDYVAMYARNAQAGRFRRSRLGALVGRWTPRGPAAIVWRELLVQSGISGFASWAVLTIAVVFQAGVVVALRVWGLEGDVANARMIGATVLLVSGAAVFLLALGAAQTGFLDMLRQVEIEKPLPFSPGTIIFWEVAAKAVFPVAVVWAMALGSLPIAPIAWAWLLASAIMAPAGSLLLISVVLFVILLFPDVDDPTQRGFRGLMTLLGLVIFGAPGLGVFGLALYLGAAPYVAALLVLALCLAMVAGLSVASGSLFASFNPSE